MTVLEILDRYRRADSDERLNLFLWRRDLRTAFEVIDASEASQALTTAPGMVKPRRAHGGLGRLADVEP